MDAATAVDRHFDFLQDLNDRAGAVLDERADEIYADLWSQCKDGIKAFDIVEKYGDIPTETLAAILQKAAEVSRAGVMTSEAKNLLCAFVMAKLTGILSDAADYLAKSE